MAGALSTFLEVNDKHKEVSWISDKELAAGVLDDMIKDNCKQGWQ